MSTLYNAWEQGYCAAIDDMARGADGRPGSEYASNPHTASLGGPTPSVRVEAGPVTFDADDGGFTVNA